MIRWLEPKFVEAAHALLIEQYGGHHGLRDAGLLDSALSRARNIEAYNPDASLAELAAAYAFGIMRNHPFIDGNKRIAMMCAFLFLELNGRRLHRPEEEATQVALACASGELAEPELISWIEKSMQPSTRKR